MPSFIRHTFASRRQARGSAGFIRGMLSTSPGRTFWTATVWTDEAAMKRFRDTAAHKAAMPRLLDLCDEASLAHWTQETDRLPEPADMLERMRTIGRLSKVREPSPGQQAGRTVPDGHPPRPSRPFGAR